MRRFFGCIQVLELCIISLFLIPTLLGGCVSGHQILKYRTGINHAENIVPGVEPEESTQKIMIVVHGKGIEPKEGTAVQKRFLAERAAVLDGYRQLSERIGGLLINGQTHSGGNTLSMDEVEIETRSFLRGAQVGPVSYHEGFATVDIRIYIEPRQNIFLTQNQYL